MAALEGLEVRRQQVGQGRQVQFLALFAGRQSEAAPQVDAG